jgi:hypothetical protein
LRGIESRFDDEADATNVPGTPTSGAPRLNNFYFAQLEEIERFGLTTLYVDFGNLLDFTANDETGVLAQAIAEQYYRYRKSLL